MPTGIYKRKKAVKSSPKKYNKKNSFLVTDTSTIDAVINMLRTVKKNKIG